ncbi:replication initiator protein [Dipodfec virus UOA04_Rod_997]|nr:replication initiator protein [Dipodfec virus UOA04_Rod_997]
MCLFPVWISNKKYTGYVPCGKCAECIEKRSVDLKFRAEQEFKACNNAYFATLTYSDDHLPLHGDLPVLNKRDVQLFLKRLRKQYGKLRYFLLGEYGSTTHRPHYHIMLFFHDPICEKDFYTFKNRIASIWDFGFITLSELNYNRIQYAIGYMCPVSELSPEYREFPPFCTFSLGFGRNYLTENRKQFYRALLKDDPAIRKAPYCYLNDRYKMALPRYYRDRIYTPSEKAEIKHCAKDDFERKVYEAELDNFRIQQYLSGLTDERRCKEFYRESYIVARERANQLVNSEKRKQKFIKKRKL